MQTCTHMALMAHAVVRTPEAGLARRRQRRQADGAARRDKASVPGDEAGAISAAVSLAVHSVI